MGAERKTNLAFDGGKTANITAHHEAGHAVVALLTEGADPIHIATIVPRGRSLGHVMQLPESDYYNLDFRQLNAKLDVCMGGRVAEELVFGADFKLEYTTT